MMQLSQVASATQGLQHGADTLLANVSINTRSDCAGRLFVALKGDNFDAHDYIDQAVSAGAAALMVEQDIETTLSLIHI